MMQPIPINRYLNIQKKWRAKHLPIAIPIPPCIAWSPCVLSSRCIVCPNSSPLPWLGSGVPRPVERWPATRARLRCAWKINEQQTEPITNHQRLWWMILWLMLNDPAWDFIVTFNLYCKLPREYTTIIATKDSMSKIIILKTIRRNYNDSHNQ